METTFVLSSMTPTFMDTWLTIKVYS